MNSLKVAVMLTAGLMVMAIPIKTQAACNYNDNCANTSVCIAANSTYAGACTYTDCADQNYHLHGDNMYLPVNMAACTITDCTESGQHIHHDTTYGPHHNETTQSGGSTQSTGRHHSRGHHGRRHH